MDINQQATADLVQVVQNTNTNHNDAIRLNGGG